MRRALVVLLLSVAVGVVFVRVLSQPHPPERTEQERVSVMDLTDSELVAAIGSFAAGGPPAAGHDVEDWAYQLREEAWDRDACRVPRERVEALLASANAHRRELGAHLTGMADPQMPETVRALALEDRDEEVREGAVRGVGLIYAEHSDLVEVLRRAQEDVASCVRAQAAGTAGWLAAEHPELAPLILRATRDGNVWVRQRALWRIDNAGKPGVDRAVEMLGGEERDPDLVVELVDCVAQAGRLREVLDGDPSVVVVTAVIDALAHPTTLVKDGPQCLAGRWEQLLPKYQPEEDWEYQYFFGLAVDAGEERFVEKAILSGKHLWAVRLAALDVAVGWEGTREMGVRAAKALLCGGSVPGTAPPRIRVRILEHLATAGRERAAAAIALLRAVAESDPSEWVRGRARCILDGR